jgi:hypothetical protein
MATLAQISSKIKTLAVAKAPKKTGNLKRKLDTYNRPAGMIKEGKSPKGKTIEFSLDVSPPGAEYGKYWNDPNVSETVRKGKTKNVPNSINFAQKAIDDSEVQRMINEYVSKVGDEITNQLVKALDDLD